MPGDLTRDQIVTEVCDVVGKSISGVSVSGADLQTRVRRYLDWAGRRLARAFDFHELNAIQENAVTVASVKRYPLVTGTNNLGLVRPKDIHSISLINGANSRTLIRWRPRKFRKFFPRPENYATMRPDIYVRFGNSIDLFKVPNDAYTLHIWYPQWPTPFTTSSQVSDFENKDELLISLTVMETYLALEEYQDASIWATKAKGQLIDAINVQGDMDWEPQADPYGVGGVVSSGTPWTDPAGTPADPLYTDGYE
jgi:hypothetical protein